MFASISLNLRSKIPWRRADFFLRRLKKGPIPRHVAVIMDGNGRWAEERSLPRLAGHRAGAKAIREILGAAVDLGVEYLTLYTFSIENWRRPQSEVAGLMKLFEEQLEAEIDELHENGVRLRTLGRLSELPDSTRQAFTAAAKRTENNKRINLNIALNYGGRAELVDALKKLIDDCTQTNGSISVGEETVERYLYTSGQPDPELLIRTSGELRLSNFLLWQIAYTEIWVTPVLWPDFKRIHFFKAVKDFQERARKFGGLEA